MRAVHVNEWMWRPQFSRVPGRARLLYLWLEASAEWPGVARVPTGQDVVAAISSGTEADGVAALLDLQKHGFVLQYAADSTALLWLPLLPAHQEKGVDELDTVLPLPSRADVDAWRFLHGRVLLQDKQRPKPVASGVAVKPVAFCGAHAQRSEMRRAARRWLDTEGMQLRIDEARLQKIVKNTAVCQPERFVEMLRLFLFWAMTHRHDPVKCMPTKDRVRVVLERLDEGYTPENIQSGIRGILLSDWHTGENPEGVTYLDLFNVCKNGRLLEKFMALDGNPFTAPAVAPGVPVDNWQRGVVEQQQQREEQALRTPLPQRGVVFAGPRRKA